MPSGEKAFFLAGVKAFFLSFDMKTIFACFRGSKLSLKGSHT